MTTQAAVTTPSAAYARRTAEETATQLETSLISGLSTTEANSRRLRHGLNEFEVEDDEPIYLKFFKSFYENPLILLLLASAGVSLAMGQHDDAISIALVMIVDAGDQRTTLLLFVAAAAAAAALALIYGNHGEQLNLTI
ncbi:High affinity Ca2+/Mn2+ P-type ATPase-like protein [Lunasporangiospora selenospora]|uniref:High affinity Ca2+/Mn2+ P-type ATPase-like protein n=1 Tax=Lunasporangiospora selenospora TaxID=979761 RepID=A0A9P6KD14_9FUNG|nr:High affinity Ca2+/Mn2+ P-type ATPase-like protein [Lunasporangiospora selenospora]